MLPRSLALVVCSVLAGCATPEVREVFNADEPKQSGVNNSMAKRGAKDFEQRKRDCWDFPSAFACYEVGLNYELGLTVEPDRKMAIEYYDKACSLEKQRDHCDAAARLRGK
jgi:TPR repeat protein